MSVVRDHMLQHTCWNIVFHMCLIWTKTSLNILHIVLHNATNPKGRTRDTSNISIFITLVRDASLNLSSLNKSTKRMFKFHILATNHFLCKWTNWVEVLKYKIASIEIVILWQGDIRAIWKVKSGSLLENMLKILKLE